MIDAVSAGETFVVTRNGEPVAELRPVRPTRSTLVPRQEVEALATGGIRMDWHQFRADVDRAIDQRL